MEQVQIYDYIKSHSERSLGAQHDDDEDIKQTHVHYCIVNPTVKDNRWGEILNKCGYTGRKDFVKLWKIPDGEHKGKAYDERRLLIYIIKGRVDSIFFNTGYNEEYTRELAGVWQAPARRFIKPSVDRSQDRTLASLDDASSDSESPQKDSKAQRKTLDEWQRIKDDFTEMIMKGNKSKLTISALRKWVNVWSYRTSKTGLIGTKCLLGRYTTSLYFYQNEICGQSLESAAEILEEEKCL